jgi:hypothetical protein
MDYPPVAAVAVQDSNSIDLRSAVLSLRETEGKDGEGLEFLEKGQRPSK